MSRASNLAKAIGADGTLNVSDVAGLAAVASSGSASDLSTGTLPIARLPTDLSGKTFSGPLIMEGSPDNNDSMLMMKKNSQSGFALLPWDNAAYLSHNIRYINGKWEKYYDGSITSPTHTLLEINTALGGLNLYAGNTFTDGNANWDFAAQVPLFDKYGNLAKPGTIVSTRMYYSGYGGGARLATSSTSWNTLPLAGTGRDPYHPSDNTNIRVFNKKRADTHLRFYVNVPIYLATAESGVGFLGQIYIGADNSTGYNAGANYTAIGSLPNGSNHGWGAHGHTGNSTNLGGSVTQILTTQNNSNASSVLAKTGNVYFYFLVSNFANTVTAYWNDYSDTYPKQAHFVVEEYIPG